MKKIFPLFLLFSFIILFASSNNYAQGKYGIIGKILICNEADQLFGEATESFPFDKDDLKFALKNAKDYIFVYVKSGNVRFTSNGKAVKNKDFDKAYFFSKSVVEEFVNSSKTDVFQFQIRGGSYFGKLKSTVATSSDGVLTISDGENVLEFALVCPPICL